MRRTLASSLTFSLLVFTPACSSFEYWSDGGPPSPPPPTPIDAASGLGDAGADPGLEPLLGPVTIATDAPPPLSGGTLLVTHDDRYAVVSDPERDRVLVVDLASHAVEEIALEAHDEPGRLVEDAGGRVHVALRRGGALITLDPTTHAVVMRRALCAAPRGLAYDAAQDRLVVACRDGELVTIGPIDEAPERVDVIDDDLRDVVVVGARRFVSRFRSAEVLVVDDAGAVLQRVSLRDDTSPANRVRMRASVAWRMIADDDGVLLLHQRASVDPIDTSTPSAYGVSDRGGIPPDAVVHTALTRITAAGLVSSSTHLFSIALGIDVARSPDGARVTVAAPGGALLAPASQLSQFDASGVGARFVLPIDELAALGGPDYRVTAVAYTSAGDLLWQTREPARLVIHDRANRLVLVDLGGATRADAGHTLFHSAAAAGVACASCHPEGAEDGHVWQFVDQGARRTQSLRGGILPTAPFHWDGGEHDFTALAHDVWSHRMGGGTISDTRVVALSHWVDALPSLAPATAASDAAARGRALFESDAVGCARCHAGATFTNDATTNVGTGGLFQVPSLRGVAARAPYMHDGCAPTLRARFVDVACGGGDQHGTTSPLSASDLDDLVAYLGTL